MAMSFLRLVEFEYFVYVCSSIDGDLFHPKPPALDVIFPAI